MTDFLTEFTQDFSPAQRQALADVASRSRDGESIGPDEIAALLATIQAGTAPLFQTPVFGAELLHGCKIGTALESIRVDLSTLLSQAQAIESTQVRQQSVFDSIIDHLHQSIIKLDELIKINKARRENAGFTDIKYVDFTAAKNNAATPTRAIVEQDAGLLVACPIDTRKYLSRGGDLKPKVTATILSPGVNPEAGKAFFPEDATQPGASLAWAELLLADTGLSGKYDNVVYEGALVQLDIELSQLEEVNEIRLTPFGRHPLDVVAASYFDGDDEISLAVTPLVLELDVTPLRFPTITTRHLRLVFRQVEYVQRSVVLDHGHIKRVGLLSFMLDRVFEATADGGTLPRALKEKRRAKAKVALDAALTVSRHQNPLERHVEAIQDILDVSSPELVRITKLEYIVGLRLLEVNWHRWASLSDYQSPPLVATGSVFEFALETIEEHQQYDDGNGAENVTSTEWEVDLGGGRILPIIPVGRDIIRAEVLDFDATLLARSKFNQAAVITVAEVRRDGELLTVTTDYVISLPVPGTPFEVTLEPSAWRPGATYTLSYDADTDQQLLNVLDVYDSIKPVRPETFPGTGEQNRVTLQSHPFVLTEITNDRNNWSRPDPWDARWIYRGSPVQRSASTNAPYVTLIDGEWYGSHPSSLALGDQGAPPDVVAANTSIQITVGGTMSGSFPNSGVVEITDTVTGQSEQVYYNGVSGVAGSVMTLNNCVRGYNNTQALDFDNTTATVKYIVNEFYAPVLVRWNGTYCRNLTDYAFGRNPAFIDRDGPPQFVQIGTSLYFDRPLVGQIEVWYRRLADQLVVRSRLRTHRPLHEETPVVDSFALKLKTSTI